jgi:hypothetical protein
LRGGADHRQILSFFSKSVKLLFHRLVIPDDMLAMIHAAWVNEGRLHMIRP